MGNMAYTTCCISKWEDLLENVSNKKDEQWFYRGMASASWKLETTLDRACKDANGSLVKAPELERDLLREFQRRFHQYSPQYMPDEDNTLEWLSLMQHYGAPTRLLDWTFSVFVAAYFAFESPKSEPDERVAIWALRWGEKEHKAFVEVIRKQDPQLAISALRLHHLPEKPPDEFSRIFMRPKRISLVRPANPFRLNERLTLQQGEFFVPGDISKSFMENLAEYQALLNKAKQCPLVVFKYVIPVKEREKALRYLNRMNVSNATLFPGLEGFARSLATNMWLMTGKY
jgi:hypothetical protein